MIWCDKSNTIIRKTKKNATISNDRLTNSYK